MKKRSIKEAISQTITPQEKQALAFVDDPGIRQSLMSLMDGMRSKGKKIDLASAANQLSQVLQMRGHQVHPDLTRLVNRPTNVPKPPQFMQMAKPAQRITPPPGFNNLPVAKISKELPPHAGTLEQTASKIAELEAQGARDQEAEFQRSLQRKNKRKQQPGQIPVTGSNTPVNVNRKSYEPEAFEKTMYGTKRENKMIKSKNQLKEAVRATIISEMRRQAAKRILTEEIRAQAILHETAVYLLTEGPLSNVWQGIKSAGSSALGAMGYKGAAQNAAKTDQQQRAREVVNSLTKTISKVHQQRQKWNSQILKSAEMMSQYHDAVVGAYELYKKYQGFLGPAGNEVNRQINELVDALQKDLMSEVSQIQAMLKSLGKKDVSLDDMLKQHQSDAEEMREREADLNPAGVTSFQRTMPSVRGGEPTARERMRRIRPETMPKDEPAPKSQKDAKKQADREMTLRVQKGDQKAFSNFEDEMEEIERTYKEMTDDLAKRALKTTDKNERRAIVRQMYDLAKSKKEREKELKDKLKGIGIRSKAGMTAAKKAYGKK